MLTPRAGEEGGIGDQIGLNQSNKEKQASKAYLQINFIVKKNSQLLL